MQDPELKTTLNIFSNFNFSNMKTSLFGLSNKVQSKNTDYPDNNENNDVTQYNSEKVFFVFLYT